MSNRETREQKWNWARESFLNIDRARDRDEEEDEEDEGEDKRTYVRVGGFRRERDEKDCLCDDWGKDCENDDLDREK